MNDEHVELPSQLENFDLGQEDGGLSDQYASHQDDELTGEESSQDETAGDDSINESQASVESNQEQGGGDGGTQGPEDDDTREHNRINAERRIAMRRQQEDASSSYLEALKQNAKERYAPSVDEERYQDIENEHGEAAADNQRRLDRLEAAEAEREINEGIREIKHFQDSIGMQSAQAENSIPLFNPKSEEYNESLASDAKRSWVREHAVIQADENGNVHILGQKEGAPSLYQYLESKAKFYQGILQDASVRGQMNANRTAGRANFKAKDVSGAKRSSSLADLEERIGDIPLA